VARTPASRRLPTPRTGCDLQRVDAVSDAIRDFGARYLDRVYTPAEQASYATGGPASLAARFAAKEAVLKLIGTTDGVDLRSIEVRTPASGNGRPEVHLTGRAAELAEALGLDAASIDLSLSHTGDLALAVAVGLQHASTGETANKTGIA
jgi:holo-[acyl-carrier protein] synthase